MTRFAPDDVVTFDLEASDRTPCADTEILQLAAVRLPAGCYDHREAIAKVNTHVKPRHPERVKPGAAKHNGFKPDDPRWTKAPDIRVALSMLFDVMAPAGKYGPIPAGHNVVAFDLPLLAAWAEATGHTMPRLGLPWDTMLEHLPLKRAGVLKSVSLKAVAAHYGIRQRRAHDAGWDVLTTLDIQCAQMRGWRALVTASEAVWGHHSDPATREHRLEPVEEAA